MINTPITYLDLALLIGFCLLVWLIKSAVKSYKSKKEVKGYILFKEWLKQVS